MRGNRDLYPGIRVAGWSRGFFATRCGEDTGRKFLCRKDPDGEARATRCLAEGPTHLPHDAPTPACEEMDTESGERTAEGDAPLRVGIMSFWCPGRR